MAEPYDRWHKAKPKPGEPRCREHNLVPSADHGHGKRWQARWRDQAGEQRAEVFDRKSDARRAEAAATVDPLRGTFVDPRAGRIAFKMAGEQWRIAQVHRATTAAQVETHLRHHVYPTFGVQALSSIRPSEIQAWVRSLEQNLAPATIRVVYSFVAGIFRAAVRDRLLVASPCVDVRLPHPEPKRVEPLATERVEALIAAMPERYRALVVLAAGTGLRHGEALGLELGAVDFLRRTPRVRQQLVTMPGQPPYLAPPKTPASHRTIPLPQVVVDALAAHLAAFPAPTVEILDTTVRPDPNRARPGWCSPTPPACRSAGPGSHPSGDRPPRRPGFPTGPPSTTCATTTPACWPSSACRPATAPRRPADAHVQPMCTVRRPPPRTRRSGG